MYIDTHAHLESERYGAEVTAVIERAVRAGVELMIDPGTDLASTRRAAEIAERFDSVYFAAGLHPYDMLAAGQDDLDALRDIAVEQGAVAIGEIGLDYHYHDRPRDRQQELFHAQLSTAEALDLPAIVHCRDAMADCFDVLKLHSVRGVMHCFAGDEADVERFTGLGLHISFTGNVTYPKAADRREAAAAVPLDRLLLETDAPYMPPQRWRGKPNEPAYVAATAQALAELHGVPLDELARITTHNARRLFNLPLEEN